MKTTIAFLSGFLIGSLVVFVGLKNWAEDRARRDFAASIVEEFRGNPLQSAINLRAEAWRTGEHAGVADAIVAKSMQEAIERNREIERRHNAENR